MEKRDKRFFLQWHITNKCNNGCKHCYQDSYDGDDVSMETAKLILADVIECCDELNAEARIAITGGDPLLHPHFFEILQLARSVSSRLAILGNPEYLNKNVIENFKKIGIEAFQFSLDGLKETHDYLRYSGSFDKTVNAIKMLSDNGIKVIVMSTVSGINYQQMAKVMKISYDNGAFHWTFARFVNQKDGDCGINAKKYINFIDEILEAQKEFKDRKGWSPVSKEPLIITRDDEECNFSTDFAESGCGLGTSMLTLLPDLTVMGCRRHPGSVLGKWSPKDTLGDYFIMHPKMDEFREIERIENCKDCKYLYFCRGCRAIAYTATGDNFGKDPQCHGILV